MSNYKKNGQNQQDYTDGTPFMISSQDSPRNINATHSTGEAIRLSSDMSDDATSNEIDKSFLEVKTQFKWMFAALVLITGFQLGYVFCYTNQTAACLNAKFGWTTTHEQDLNESIIGSSCCFSMVFGSAFAGKIIKKGRRRGLILSAFVGFVGISITLIQNYPLIVIGRLIYGLSVSLISVGFPRYIEEMMPAHLVGQYAGLYCFSFALATMIAYGLAAFLPPDDDTLALEETGAWRITFGMPLIFFALELILFFTYFPTESPKFLLLTGHRDQAEQSVARIYSDPDVGKITDYIYRHSNKKTVVVATKEAFYGRRYKNGTWVALAVMFFHEMTGNNVVLLYSNSILADMNPDSQLTPRQFTYIIGAFNLFSSSVSIWSARTFTRTFLFVWGHFTMAICLGAIGLFIQIGYPTVAFIFILLFLFSFQNTSGAITWLYCSEVAIDTALGYVGTSGYVAIFFLTSFTPTLMDSAIQQQGTFWLFGIFSAVAFVWMFFYLKDTTYLDDAGKKSLYVPDDLKQADHRIAKLVESEIIQIETEQKDPELQRDKPYR